MIPSHTGADPMPAAGGLAGAPGAPGAGAAGSTSFMVRQRYYAARSAEASCQIGEPVARPRQPDATRTFAGGIPHEPTRFAGWHGLC